MDTNSDNQLFQLCQRIDAKLDTMSGDFREFKGGMSVRVETLQKEQDSQKFWHTLKTVAVIPVVAVLHQIAAHFGWIK